MARKLIFAFSCILIVFASTAFFNLRQIQQIDSQFGRQYETFEKERLALHLKQQIQLLVDTASELMIEQNTSLTDTFEEAEMQYMQLVHTFRNGAETTEERRFGAFLETVSNEYSNYFKDAVAAINDPFQKAEEVDAVLKSTYRKMKLHKDYITEMIDEINSLYAAQAIEISNQAHDTLKETASLFTTMPPVVIIFSGLIAAWIIRSFVRPIRELQTAVSRMAQGDLRHKINVRTKDELGVLGRNFNSMIDRMTEMTDANQQLVSMLNRYSVSLRQFSTTTAAANEEMMLSMKEITAGMEKQADQAENGSAMLHEMSVLISQSRQDTNHMKQTSEQVLHNTSNGSLAVDKLQQSSLETVEMLQKLYSAAEHLFESIAAIEQLTDKITLITQQTNILSLNASIEASRAGQHGKGFAVIAEEIGSLSDITRESSKQISGTIERLKGNMDDTQQKMLQASQKIRLQENDVLQTMSAFNHIQQSTDELIEQIHHMYENMENSYKNARFVVQSFEQTAALSEEMAASTEELYAASQKQDDSISKIAKQAVEMAELSEKLYHQMNKFQTAAKRT